MKRVIALLLALAMVISMAACGKQEAAPTTTTTQPAQTTVDVSTMTQEQQQATTQAAQEIVEERTYRNTYKTSFSRSYSSFNYFATAYATVCEIVANCIDGLIEPDIYGVYQPSLAESWEHNDDYSVWTFHIRKGVKWVDCNGNETQYDVTAEDFVDGIRYIGDPLNGAYSMRVVRNLIDGLYDYYWDLDDIDCGDKDDMTREEAAARFDDMVGVKALDDYTVQYTLDGGAPYFLSLIESSMLLLPIQYDWAMEQGDDFGVDAEHLLYCGGYYISHFERDKAITLTVNPHYWDLDKMTLDTVEYQIIPDGTTSLEMFKRGEIDYVSVDGESYLSLQGTEWEDNMVPNEFSFSTNYLWLDFVGANSEFRTFVQNENFRKALQCAVNRTSLASLRDATSPERLVRYTINAEGAIYDKDGVDYVDYAPLKEVREADYSADLARGYMEAAIADLCEADGTIKGCSAEHVDYLPVIATDTDGKLPVTLIYVGTDSESEIVMGQLIEAMIEDAIGTDYIDVVLAFDTSGDFYGTVGGSNSGPFNYDIYWDSLSTGYADPSGILSRIGSDGVENVGDYDVPEFDDLFDKALEAETFEERLEYMAEAEAFIVKGAYMIPVISNLRGYHMSYEVPYTSMRALYGNEKYKGVLVSEEPITAEEHATLKAAWEIERNKALAGE